MLPARPGNRMANSASAASPAGSIELNLGVLRFRAIRARAQSNCAFHFGARDLPCAQRPPCGKNCGRLLRPSDCIGILLHNRCDGGDQYLYNPITSSALARLSIAQPQLHRQRSKLRAIRFFPQLALRSDDSARLTANSALTRRPPSAPPERPPGECPPCRCASCAFCLPFAFPGACVSG